MTKSNLLPQPNSVQLLIDYVTKCAESHDGLKTATETLLKVFDNERAVCCVRLTDIIKKATEYDITLSNADAKKILADIVTDIEQNHLDDILKYHINEYAPTQQPHHSPIYYNFFVDEQLSGFDPVFYSHFDCWTLEEDDDPNGETFEWGCSGAELLALSLVDDAAEMLGADLVAISSAVKYGTFESRHAFFVALGNAFLKQDYYVYLSDSMFEVYQGVEARTYYTPADFNNMR